MAAPARIVSQSSLEEKDKVLLLHNHKIKKITTKEVYELGKEIAQEMQRITADYGKGCLERLVEKVVRSLEWLEVCAVQNEELQKSKCQLLLLEDELAREREKAKRLQTELKGMSLVVDERGRQRDLFASKLSELETQNKNYQEMLTAYEQAFTRKQRSKRYSMAPPEENGEMSFHSRTKSLDRREMKPMKPMKVTKGKEKDALIEQLQKELIQEKRRVTEVRESTTLDQKRVQQRMRHMDQEIVSLTRQLSIAHTQVERLKQEKTALAERSEVLNEVRAIQLATVARQDSGSDDSGSSPQFYKKDLLMILKERNELKEKIIGLEEELASTQKRRSSGSRRRSGKEHSPRSKRASASYCSAPCIQEVWERNEGSMVILEVPNYYIQQGKSTSMKTVRSSSNSGSDRSLVTNSFSSDQVHVNGHTTNNHLAGSQDDIDSSTSL